MFTLGASTLTAAKQNPVGTGKNTQGEGYGSPLFFVAYFVLIFDYNVQWKAFTFVQYPILYYTQK